MLLAPSQRNKPLRQALGDSVSEIEHSLQSLNFNSNAASQANTDTHKTARLPPSCQPAKPTSLNFWQAHLNAAAPHGQNLTIAYDKARSHGPSGQGEVPVAIPDGARYRVPAAADTTCGMTLLAAFHAFLCRISYSQQQQLVLGVQPSHLLMPQASAALDPSASTSHLVPLCCPEIGPTDTIQAHAHKLHSLLLDLAPHALTSLPDICTAAGITPAPGTTPQQALFRAAVVYARDAASGRAAAAGLDVALMLLHGPKPGSRHTLQAVLLTSQGLFSQEGAGLMARHFEVFLAEVVKDHNSSSNSSNGSSSSFDGEPCLVPMLNAPLMDAAESQLLLQGPGAAAMPAGGAVPLLHELVTSHAKARPDAACLVHDARVFTYKEVDVASSRIAAYLAGAAGVQPGSTVALLLGRGPLLIAGLLGVLKAGAAYLTLDGSNKSHMQMMLEDACVQVVITQPDLQRLLPASIPLHTLLLHPDKATEAAPCGSLLPPACLGTAGSMAATWVAEEMDSWLDSSMMAAEPGCVLYGAAGCSKAQPNGMLITHAGLAAYAASFKSHFGITAADVFIKAAPSHAAASIDELWGCLAAGAALVLAPPELHKDANAFMQLIARYHVTTVCAAPSVLHQVAKRAMALYPTAAATGSGPCCSLLRVLCSEEPLTPSKAQAISVAMPRAALHYIFRTTEACPGITSWLVAAPPSNAAATPDTPPHTGLLIGLPLGPSTKLYVLDSLQRPVPIGVPGELHISGAASPCGALRPGLQGACFSANPFCEGPGSGSMLATGGVVRWLPAGQAGGLGPLELIGHLDESGKLKTIVAEAQAAMEENPLDRVRHSRSFNDVKAVDAGHALHPPPLKKIRRSAMSEALFTNGRLKAVQEDENEVAEVVIVCEPESATLMMGGLHPRGSLYERPVNIDTAKAQHTGFREVLRAHGVRVLTVREILAFGVEERMGARVELEELAAGTLTYRLADGHKESDLTDADRHYISDAYKREVVSAMSTSQLIEICLINPTVTLLPSYRDTGLTASYTFEPLSNLVYTRDQQVTTCKGIVMGRLRSTQRQKEVELMSYCFRKLGLPIAGRITEPGFLEGGDFFPMGQDLALVGVGLRSNVEACQQLMDKDLLGTRRLGVVRDDFDRDQDRMHLDCVFSVLGEGCCIMLETIIGEASATRRLVDEYVRDAATGKYRLAREGVEFSSFIRGEGYDIIPIKHEHQLAYACNVLNLGKGRIISVHTASAREIVKHEAFKGDVQVIDFSSVTSMYGSVHCASQVVRRVPRRFVQQEVNGVSEDGN